MQGGRGGSGSLTGAGALPEGKLLYILLCRLGSDLGLVIRPSLEKREELKHLQ